MRFRRLSAHVFGALRGRELELPAESVLVYGPNESGKSTFRAALETILYGFDPADRELHPLARWEGGAAGNLHLEAELDLETGRVFRVERDLLARPGVRIAEGSAPFAGPRTGNLALECTSGVPREVFRGVYSLELGELSALGDRTRAHVDALLLPQLAALGLRPVGEVRAELAGEHRGLWRPDRIGKHVAAREKEQEIAQLREDAGKAAAEEQALREARVEQAALEAHVKTLREQRGALSRALEDAPLLASLAELERRRRGLGAPIDLSGLEGLPLVDPDSLAAEIAQLEQQTALPKARLEREAEILSEPERTVESLSPEIVAAVAALPDQRADRQRLSELRERAADLRGSIRRELASVLARAPGEAELAAALAVPCQALRATHSSWAGAWEQHARGSSARAPRGWLLAAAASIALGLAGVLVEPLAAQLPDAVARGALGLGLICLLVAMLPRREPPAPALGDLLGALAPAPHLLASPVELSRLIERIERVQSSNIDLEASERAARAVEESLAGRETSWQSLGQRLGWTGEGESLLGRLAAARDQLLARASRVEEDRRERQSAAEQIAALTPLLERKRRHAQLLHEAFCAAEPSAATDALAHQAVTRRLAEAEFVQRREAELRREARYSALACDPRLLAENSEDDWSPGAIEQGRRDLARLNDELEAATTRQGEIRTQLAGAPGSRQAKIADRIQEARNELAAAKRGRDRLALLESILVRAERSFRDQHQPDVLRRAGLYLERVTGGRWRRLDREGEADGRLLVTGGERSDSVPAEPPLSRGTLDQIFLCLRLGLLDHLDEGRERLPLILDDALLRTDDARRCEIYPLLAEVSRRRQVFLLTCQDWIASEAEQRMQVRRISLAP